MSHLIVDEGLVGRLRGLVEPIEFRDPAGKILGHDTPVVSPEEAAAYEKAKKLFDLKEAECVAATQRNGCSLEELLQRLQSLEKKG